MDVLVENQFVSVFFVGLGLILLFLEIFVPSGGILGVLSLLSVGFGLFGLFRQGSYFLATANVLVAVAFTIWVIRFGLKRISMSGVVTPEMSTSVDESLSKLLGKTGTTLTPCRPAGIARIDEARVDVVASGRLIEKDSPIEVVDVTGNRVVVREVRAHEPASGESA